MLYFAFIFNVKQLKKRCSNMTRLEMKQPLHNSEMINKILLPLTAEEVLNTVCLVVLPCLVVGILCVCVVCWGFFLVRSYGDGTCHLE